MTLWDDMRRLHQSLALGEGSAQEPGTWRNPGESEGRSIVVSVTTHSQFLAMERATGVEEEMIEVFLSRDESPGATEPGVRVPVIGATLELSATNRYGGRYTFKGKVIEQDACTQRLLLIRPKRVTTGVG